MMSFLKRLFGKGDGVASPGLDHDAIMARAHEELRIKTAAHDRLWSIGSAAWSVDLGAGTIVFDAPDGKRATAPVQVVGTLDTTQGTWMWGWDHPSVPVPCARDAAKVRDYGAERGFADLTTKIIACDEAKAWDYAALAAFLSGAQGAYRGPTGSTFVFMTFGNVALSSGDGAKAPRAEKDFGAGLEPTEAPEALALVQSYCREIAAIEKAHYELPDDEQETRFEEAIAAMQPVYDRYWRRGDDYWRPVSVASQSECDLSLMQDWKTFSRGPDQFRVTYVRVVPHLRSPRAFDVERFPDGLRIVDHLF